MVNLLKLFFFALLFAPLTSSAEVLDGCLTLMSEAGQDSSTDGTIYKFKGYDLKSLSVIATAANTAGNSPTLDVVLQSCRTTAAASCSTRKTFDQCTTGDCWTDGDQSYDFDINSEHLFPYVRAVTTIGGTSTPTYDVTVELCFAGEVAP